MIHSPCRDCENCPCRSHDSCEKFLAYKQTLAEIKKLKLAASIADDTTLQAVRRCKKYQNRKKEKN